MKVVVVANPKGGAGKSTLTQLLMQFYKPEAQMSKKLRCIIIFKKISVHIAGTFSLPPGASTPSNLR
jgi:ABC-type polysaccharide/polyol phosphate transport system ATPase subunit